jgi:preprotein translocase subunit SecD
MVRIAVTTRLMAAASLFLVTVATAEPVTLEVRSAKAGQDKRSGEPMLSIAVTTASKQALRDLSSNNIGRKLELRVDGKTILTSIFREPILGGVMEVSGDMGADRTQALAAELSKSGIRVEIEALSN